MPEKITLVFAQCGARAEQLEPSLSSFRRWFPEAEAVLYSDRPVNAAGVTNRVAGNPFGGPRAGHRYNDLFKAVGLMDVQEGFGIALDCDMAAVSGNVRTIIPMAARFGLCVPCNPRLLVRLDNTVGEDSDGWFGEDEGWGYAMNMSPIAFSVKHAAAHLALMIYREAMMKRPVRGPSAMWRACWEAGFFPCLLPPQWCVCGNDCGVGNEIVLHVGHEKVRNHYANLIR